MAIQNKLAPGTKVHVELDGTIEGPTSGGAGYRLAVPRSKLGFPRVVHTIFMDEAIEVKVNEPHYILGQAYQAADGQLLFRARSKKAPNFYLGWRSWSGKFYKHSEPKRPLVRLIPEV